MIMFRRKRTPSFSSNVHCPYFWVCIIDETSGPQIWIRISDFYSHTGKKDFEGPVTFVAVYCFWALEMFGSVSIGKILGGRQGNLHVYFLLLEFSSNSEVERCGEFDFFCRITSVNLR